MTVIFDNILNFRDVGKTVNDYLGRKLVREGVLYRSARPDDASPEDRERLRDEFGIKTVVDLRTNKLIFLFLLGYRTQAISLISREVLLPHGLIGLGLITIDESGAEIADTLRTLLAPSSTPLLVHCTQGKDRTGLVVALVLMALSVPASAIDHDYMLSRAGLSSEQESRLEEIREIGLTAEWGDASPDFVAAVVEHIDVKYGGVDGYLDSVGFDASERRRLVEVLGA